MKKQSKGFDWLDVALIAVLVSAVAGLYSCHWSLGLIGSVFVGMAVQECSK